jgi:uncharacterized UBP type Zn finger protein
VQVKGMKSLSTSLQTLVAADVLEGNNQYSCARCGMKTDADRKFCIRKLPPCLRLNLSRFNFDWASGTKQKVRSCRLAVPFCRVIHEMVHESVSVFTCQSLQNAQRHRLRCERFTTVVKRVHIGGPGRICVRCLQSNG